VTEALFTYDEADVILRGDGQSDFVGVNAIDGLIAAVAAGPVFIASHEWLPQIFGFPFLDVQSSKIMLHLFSLQSVETDGD
jgi:hypothetical protein